MREAKQGESGRRERQHRGPAWRWERETYLYVDLGFARGSHVPGIIHPRAALQARAYFSGLFFFYQVFFYIFSSPFPPCSSAFLKNV